MQEFQVTFPEGIRCFVLEELESLHQELSSRYTIQACTDSSLQFSSTIAQSELKALKTVTAVFRLMNFRIPRPKGLLGHEHFTRLIRCLTNVTATEKFNSFRIEAAGRNSTVFRRLQGEIATALGLPFDAKNGELQIRCMPDNNNWCVLVRITPAPLSKRCWRVANMPGALNGAIAASMIRWLAPTAGVYCNLACGSGTLLIEAKQYSPALSLIGIEISAASISLLEQNLRAAKVNARVIHADASTTGLDSGSVDYIVSDLPWGERIGNRSTNATLYQQILRESERILKPGGSAVFISQHAEALDAALSLTSMFEEVERFKVFQKGYWPIAVKLRRK